VSVHRVDHRSTTEYGHRVRPPDRDDRIGRVVTVSTTGADTGSAVRSVHACRTTGSTTGSAVSVTVSTTSAYHRSGVGQRCRRPGAAEAGDRVDQPESTTGSAVSGTTVSSTDRRPAAVSDTPSVRPHPYRPTEVGHRVDHRIDARSAPCQVTVVDTESDHRVGRVGTVCATPGSTTGVAGSTVTVPRTTGSRTTGRRCRSRVDYRVCRYEPVTVSTTRARARADLTTGSALSTTGSTTVVGDRVGGVRPHESTTGWSSR
jgi:hypothetical protein